MADIKDADESMRLLAHRIPEFTLADLSRAELNVRLRYVLDLQAKADANPDNADRLRRRAEKALKAMSPAAYAAALGRLDDALADAQLRGASREAMTILEEINLLKRTHPQPDPSLYVQAGMAAVSRELDRRVKIPPRVGSKLFSRNHKRR